MVMRWLIRCSDTFCLFSSHSQSSGLISEYVTSRFSACANSRATPCMSCERGPVSSYIRPMCGPGSARTVAITRATSAAATGGLAASKRQFDTTALADTRARQGEKALQEHGRPDGDDREAGPREYLFA